MNTHTDTNPVHAAAIERARRWDGRTHCEINGCPEYATMEHVLAHIANPADMERRLAERDALGR